MRASRGPSLAWAVAVLAVAGLLAGLSSIPARGEAGAPPATVTTPAFPSPTGIHGSGSVNTRVYVTGINSLSQPQGNGSFMLTGHVHVVNVSSLQWEPWAGVSVAMRMNNSVVMAGGYPVNATTGPTGNFTLVYVLPIFHPVGRWNITAGVSPIPEYNYTYNPAFAGTTTYDVNVTANSVIDMIGFLPLGFWNDEVFSITARLRTQAGGGIPGVTVNSVFNGTHVFTSNLTGPGGQFGITLAYPLNESFPVSLQFAGSGFINPCTANHAVPYIETAFHAFSGGILLHGPSNPKIVNTDFTLEGRFTYNTSLYPGDGNVKNKRVLAFWIDNASVEHPIGNAITGPTGVYSMPCHVNVSNPLSGTPTRVVVRVRLDVTTVVPIEFARDMYIRPLVPTLLAVSFDPAWRDEPVRLWGTLRENEGPTYTQFLAGRDVNVTLYDGATVVASVIVTTNTTGGFFHEFSPLHVTALTYVASFPVTDMHDASSGSGPVPIYINATFTFDAGMVAQEYPGVSMNVYARARANLPGYPSRIVVNRDVFVYWDGTYWATVPLDGNGFVNFGFPIPEVIIPGIHALTLQLADFNETGYDVSSTYLVDVVPLEVLTVTSNLATMTPVFYHLAFTINGSVSAPPPAISRYPNAFGNINITITLDDGSTALAYSVVTSPQGLYSVTVPAGDLFASNMNPFSTHVTIQTARTYIYASSSLGPLLLRVIEEYRFLRTTASNAERLYITSTFSVAGRIQGRFGAMYYNLPDGVFDYSFNGRYQGPGMTDSQGRTTVIVVSDDTDLPGGSNVLSFLLQGDTHPSIPASFFITVTLVDLDPLSMTMHPSIEWGVLEGEPFVVEGNVSATIPGMQVQVILAYGGGSTAEHWGNTDAAGRFLFEVPASLVTGDLASITVRANPGLEFLRQSAVRGPYTVAFITGITFSDVTIQGSPASTVTSLVQGSSVIVTGRLVASDTGLPVRSRVVLLTVSDQDVGVAQFAHRAGADGVFRFSIPVPTVAPRNITITLSTAAAALPEQEIEFPAISIVLPNDSSWVLWLVPPVVVGLLLLGVAYTRLVLKKEKADFLSKMQRRLEVVRGLAAAGKPREAISYCYHILVEIATNQFDLDEKKDGQTVREFMELLIKEKGVPPEHGFGFLDVVLEGLYSHHDITREHVSRAVGLLGSIHVSITGDATEPFTL